MSHSHIIYCSLLFKQYNLQVKNSSGTMVPRYRYIIGILIVFVFYTVTLVFMVYSTFRVSQLFEFYLLLAILDDNCSTYVIKFGQHDKSWFAEAISCRADCSGTFRLAIFLINLNLDLHSTSDELLTVRNRLSPAIVSDKGVSFSPSYNFNRSILDK